MQENYGHTGVILALAKPEGGGWKRLSVGYPISLLAGASHWQLSYGSSQQRIEDS